MLVSTAQYDYKSKSNHPRHTIPNLLRVGTDLEPRNALDVDNRWQCHVIIKHNNREMYSQWTRRGTFDGIRRLMYPTNPAALTTPITGITSTVDIAKLQAQIAQQFESAKEQNQYTKDILLQYHKSFAALYQASENIRLQQKEDFRKKIEILQEQCKTHQSLGHHYLYTTVEFVPKNVEVVEDMEYYIRKAMREGKTLAEVLPPTILAQRLDAYSSANGSSRCGASSSTSSHCGASSSTSSHCGETSNATSNTLNGN